MFLKCKYLFISKHIDKLCICSSVQTINCVTFSKLHKYSLSLIRVRPTLNCKILVVLNLIELSLAKMRHLRHLR